VRRQHYYNFTTVAVLDILECKYKKANSVPQAHLTPNQIRRKSTGTKRE